MVSLRFPFSFFHRPQTPSSSHFALSIGVIAVGFGTGLAISHSLDGIGSSLCSISDLSRMKPGLFSSPLFASLSLASEASDPEGFVVDSRSGAKFPQALGDSQKLVGIGLRKKSIVGIKNITVYAFGVYADDRSIKHALSEKYGVSAPSELKGDDGFCADILDSDLCMTVKLSIVYSRLSIRSVRNAFEESVGNRLKKFSGDDSCELLQRFTSQFKDELRLSRGTIIELAREKGHVLHTKIDGKEVGCIQSQLLCRSIFDLYIGQDAFDKQAKDDIQQGLASLLHE